MAQIDQIININVQLQATAVPQPSFSIPLIVGPNAPFMNGDTIRYYSSKAGALADGYSSGNPEIAYLAEALEQALVPTLVGLGKRTTAVKQVDTIAVSTLDDTHLYAFTLNGSVISYQASGSDTQQAILAALLTDIGTVFPTNPPVTGVVTGTGSGALLTLTSSVFGQAVSYSAVDAKLTQLNVTPNNGIANDLQAILNQPVTGNNWYGLSLCSQTAADIGQTAAFIENLKKIYIADSGDSDIPTSSTSDIASVLKAKGYNRTALMYSPVSAALGMSAAWLGGQLPQVPGASTWKFKQLAGIAADSFTDSQRLNLIGIPGVPGKNANIYEAVGGVNITEDGWAASGRFLDITVGIDWFEITLQVNIYALLVQNAKIPYTNAGATVIENAIRQTIKQGVSNGLIDGSSPITVSVPDTLSVSQNTRSARISPTFSFNFRLAGAYHYVVVNGTVTT